MKTNVFVANVALSLLVVGGCGRSNEQAKVPEIPEFEPPVVSLKSIEVPEVPELRSPENMPTVPRAERPRVDRAKQAEVKPTYRVLLDGKEREIANVSDLSPLTNVSRLDLGNMPIAAAELTQLSQFEELEELQLHLVLVRELKSDEASLPQAERHTEMHLNSYAVTVSEARLQKALLFDMVPADFNWDRPNRTVLLRPVVHYLLKAVYEPARLPSPNGLPSQAPLESSVIRALKPTNIWWSRPGNRHVVSYCTRSSWSPTTSEHEFVRRNFLADHLERLLKKDWNASSTMWSAINYVDGIDWDLLRPEIREEFEEVAAKMPLLKDQTKASPVLIGPGAKLDIVNPFKEYRLSFPRLLPLAKLPNLKRLALTFPDPHSGLRPRFDDLAASPHLEELTIDSFAPTSSQLQQLATIKKLRKLTLRWNVTSEGHDQQLSLWMGSSELHELLSSVRLKELRLHNISGVTEAVIADLKKSYPACTIVAD